MNRRFLALCGIVLLVLALFWPATRLLLELWTDYDHRTYTHGLLVAAVCGVLLWRTRAAIDPGAAPAAGIAPRLPAAVALLLLVLGWQIAYRAGIQSAVETLLLPILWLAIYLLLGARALGLSLFPIGFLVFAMPVWDGLNPLAQDLSVHAVRLLLRMVDIPAFFEANRVRIPSGEFEIAEGCSGLHFIIVALAITALLGEMRGDGWRMRLRWLLLGLGLALLVNWLRIFSLIVIGHLTHMQNYLVRVSHYGYGWLLFMLVLATIFLIERRTPLPPLPTRGTGAAVPDPPRRGSPAWSAITVAVLALPLALNVIIDARTAPLADAITDEVRPPWAATSSDATGSDWRPLQHNADREGRWTVRADGSSLERYRAQYREQKPGKKLGGYANRLQGEASIVESDVQNVDGHAVGEMALQSPAGRSLLWFTYRIDGREFIDATRAQLWYSWRTLWSLNSPESEARALRARCEPSCGDARQLLGRFLADNHGEL